MRALAVLAAAIIAVTAAAGCGDDDDVDQLGGPVEDAPAYDDPQELAEVLDCADSYEEIDVTAEPQPVPRSASGRCTYGGGTVEINMFATADDMQATERFIGGQFCERDLEAFSYVAGNLWLLGIEGFDDHAFALHLADQVEGESRTITC
jgi:hypothetical protein